LLIGSTSLAATTAADNSGAYLIGVFDEFSNSDSTNIQAVINDLDAAITSGGAAQNLFETIATTSGTSPVADTATDTLTLAAGDGITLTGDETTDTISFAATLGTSIATSEITD